VVVDDCRNLAFVVSLLYYKAKPYEFFMPWCHPTERAARKMQNDFKREVMSAYRLSGEVKVDGVISYLTELLLDASSPLDPTAKIIVFAVHQVNNTKAHSLRMKRLS